MLVALLVGWVLLLTLLSVLLLRQRYRQERLRRVGLRMRALRDATLQRPARAPYLNKNSRFVNNNYFSLTNERQ